MIRYRAKKWWSLKESPDGQYVAYHEHEEAMDKLRYENDKLWERIAQQAEEYEKLKAAHLEWIDKSWHFRVQNDELEIALKDMRSNVWMLVAVLIFSVVVAVGIIYKSC
jgi:predicted nuclease with TOPRIM domain